MLTIQEKSLFRRVSKIYLARHSFWDYCKVREPNFYQDSHSHLKKLCTTLNNFYFGLPLDATGKIYQNLMINMPPQHGKTRTLVNFSDWVLGIDPQETIITGSYNDSTAWDFSKFTRDGITQQKIDPNDIVFSDIFPNVKIKRGSSSYEKWALEGRHFNYMGVGIGGSVTSKGASVLIFDDLVKSAEDALNINYLDRVWLWFSSTFLSRVSAEAERLLRIACMTRWHKNDPCGRLLELMPNDWYVLKMEAYDKETDQMLCKDFLDRETYFDIKKLMLEEIFEANYHQKTIDIKGKLYKKFKTYDKLPHDEDGNLLYDRIGCYTDTADEGTDYLASGIYLEYQKVAYMLDIYYTKDGMEITEPETAKRLTEYKVNSALVESNSGGRGFARNVKRILRENLGNINTIIRWFHQSKNKKSRILSESANVMENILMPVDWRYRWPEFYKHVNDYQKEGKNQIDDGPDMLTGIVERIGRKLIEVLK